MSTWREKYKVHPAADVFPDDVGRRSRRSSPLTSRRTGFNTRLCSMPSNTPITAPATCN